MDPRTVLEGEALSFDPGTIIFDFGVSGGMSDYLSNRLIDLIRRDEAYVWPSNLYAAYTTTAPTNAALGLEPGVGGYARVAIPSTLAGWTPTQGGLTTDPSPARRSNRQSGGGVLSGPGRRTRAWRRTASCSTLRWRAT